MIEEQAKALGIPPLVFTPPTDETLSAVMAQHDEERLKHLRAKLAAGVIKQALDEYGGKGNSSGARERRRRKILGAAANRGGT
jgi:hypothetical protein